MLLIEQGGVPQAALPIAALKDHLRLGSGFADDALQDALAESYLRSALGVIEGRTAKVLIARDFLLVLEDWRQAAEQALPVAPVTAVASVTLFDGAGVGTVVAADRYRLVRDTHRPKIAATGVLLPEVVEGGRAEILFTAGFGDWADVPADLAQAVFLLAAEYYEMRHEAGVRQAQGLPHAVQVLIERWRTVRVLGGAAR
jgi:uncharacterized phiE125 gp8 family phage protein